MQRGEGVKDEKGYDVVRFIEHGGKCRPAMDYVRGQTLIGRLQTEKKIPKKAFYFNGFGCCVPSWIVIIEVKGCSVTGI